MMTEEQKQAFSNLRKTLVACNRLNYCESAIAALEAALTQPAGPPLKLPISIEPEDVPGLIDPTANPDEYACCVGKDVWDACLREVAKLNAPHTAPIEPICATGGAEWVSNERVEEIIYRAEMFGHGAGYLPDEVIRMAKELLALRKAFSEPYGYVHQGVYEAGFSSGLSADHKAYKNSSTHIPLYRKP